MARIALKELETDRSLAVEQLESLIGRDPACGIVIEGPKSKVVSGRHARIFFHDNGWWIQDMSRNGTILDDERLQNGQRHALRVGQLIGLGESGPRLRVTTLESRPISETIVEQGRFGTVGQTTAPRVRPMSAAVPTNVAADEGTSAMRKSEALRAGLRVEEPTEPAKLGGTWHLTARLRATHSGQRFEAEGSVVKIGRSPECAIRIPPEQGASVSRVHAELALGGAGIVVRDAGSRNGTLLNGARLDGTHPVMIGDKLMLGAGGPTLEVEELHIVRGTAPGGSAPRIGTATPEAFPNRPPGGEPRREPPTAPSPASGDADSAAPDTRAMGTTRSPARGVSPQAAESAHLGPGRSRLALYVTLAVLALAAAVVLGRIATS